MMNRKRKPKLPEGMEMPTVETRVDPELVTQTRRYKLITPLFGGGVIPGEADPITIVRATEVRGHLRFWWRATRGGQFDGDLEKMRKAEEAIWGSAAGKDKPGPSGVQVLVTKIEGHEGEPDHPFEVVPQRRDPRRPSVRANRDSKVHPYAAFPLQPEQRTAVIGMETKAVLVDAQFCLNFAYPMKFQQDIEAAIWAWETFGGLGARTRRGFGAVQCVQAEGSQGNEAIPFHAVLKSTDEVVKSFIEGMKRHLSTGKWDKRVPHLEHKATNYRFVFNDEPNEVWEDMIEALKEFRQDRREGRSEQQPGRSFWPEPEAIRRMTRQRHPDHGPLGPELDVFPRARFGLPIIFHFKDSNTRYPDDPKSDPADTSLQGAGKIDRMSSPLILRPLAFGDNQAIGLAAILSTPPEPPGGLRLKAKFDEYEVSADISDIADQIAPLHRLNDDEDILQAFLNFLKAKENK